MVLTTRPSYWAILRSMSSARWALWRASVPASLAAMSRLKPTMSAATAAASLRATRSLCMAFPAALERFQISWNRSKGATAARQPSC